MVPPNNLHWSALSLVVDASVNFGSIPMTFLRESSLALINAFFGAGTICNNISSSLVISTSRTPGCRIINLLTSFFWILFRLATTSALVDESKFSGTFGGWPSDFMTVET